ncbi:glycosyltransferase [bacterium]|nr:glycosyltransferase [bacterium]
MNFAKKISIIVPVGQSDESWRSLLSDLKPIRKSAEFIFCGPKALEFPEDWKNFSNVRFLRTPNGRARQMNFAAAQASRDVLWFLHADSKFTPDTLSSLKELMKREIKGVHFFNLGFFDGPPWMVINTLGVWFRSHFLKLPFGDQGFLMEKSLFEKLGGFPESAPFGEDHLLIWKAHELGSPVTPISGKLLTSARKYVSQGWLTTTCKHLYLTLTQSKQELRRIVKVKKGIS